MKIPNFLKPIIALAICFSITIFSINQIVSMVKEVERQRVQSIAEQIDSLDKIFGG